MRDLGFARLRVQEVGGWQHPPLLARQRALDDKELREAWVRGVAICGGAWRVTCLCVACCVAVRGGALRVKWRHVATRGGAWRDDLVAACGVMSGGAWRDEWRRVAARVVDACR